jgi:hypothetical protein
MAWSRVAIGKPCARAVATINRSAGSPWNFAGSAASAMITSRSTGSTETTLASVACANQAANGHLALDKQHSSSRLAQRMPTNGGNSVRAEKFRAGHLLVFL